MRAGSPRTSPSAKPVVTGWAPDRVSGQFLQRLQRLRSLNRRSAHNVDSANSTSQSNLFVRDDVLEILILIRSVDADEVVIVGDLVHQDVVDESAMLVEQPGVLRLADLQLRGVRWWRRS